VLLLSCQRSGRVELNIDFSKAASWRYLFGIDIKGIAGQDDSLREFSNSLRTYISGERSPHDAAAVRFRTGQTVVHSNFLSEPERVHLARQCENMVLFFSPREGAVETSDTAVPPLLTVGGWDLYRSFARVLPVLPESPVAPGTSWDRERSFPLETSFGNATGMLYQVFTLDSVFSADSSNYASLSWRFTYRIQPDSAGVLDSLPLSGTGNGTAVIDMTRKRMAKAHALFEVPAKQKARQKISWQETVHIEMVN
jgi:hypothetical protein